MKITKSIIAALFVLLTAQMASAYYCPSAGRWLSRDPIGEPGFQALQATTKAPQVGNVPSSQPARWLNRDPIGEKGGKNLYCFVINNPINLVDKDGRQETFPNPEPTPYSSSSDGSGLNYVTIKKCNVLVFYGHGFADTLSDGSPVDWKMLTPAELNESDLPARVKNELYSSAEVYGCNTGHYVQVQTPTPGAENPMTSVYINTGIDGLWSRARAQAKAICSSVKCPCKTVTITFENRLSWYERDGEFFLSSTKTETIKCH